MPDSAQDAFDFEHRINEAGAFDGFGLTVDLLDRGGNHFDVNYEISGKISDRFLFDDSIVDEIKIHVADKLRAILTKLSEMERQRAIGGRPE